MRRCPRRDARITSYRPHARFIRSAAHSGPFPARTHSCGTLSAVHVGDNVVIAGWLLPERKVSKSLSFFPLRDSYGTTQLVVSHKDDSLPLCSLSHVPTESVVLIEGQVRLRPHSSMRLDQQTGSIEVFVKKFSLLNPANDMPFMPSDSKNMANEDLRARYRYLDLRRSELSRNLRKRSKVTHIVRTVLNDEDFVEVETPILLKSTPEGAREFLVPTRVTGTQQSGNPLFYALPQSPQQPKQLLMCSGGIDKYFQLARCFRDEDGRKDRQPEFTQIDLEMAFVSWSPPVSSLSVTDGWRIGGFEVRQIVEKLVNQIWSQIDNVELPEIKVITYQDAMARFGSDKPDTRFDLEIQSITNHLPSFNRPGELVECIVLHHLQDSPYFAADLRCQADHEPALERILISEANFSSWVSEITIIRQMIENSPVAESAFQVNERLNLSPGDVIWLARRAAVAEGGSTTLGRLRLRLSQLAQESGHLILPSTSHFLWVTEFPLFTHDGDKNFQAHGRWSSTHHPFTAPMWEDIPALYDGRFDEVRGQHYDLVVNGIEIGGGSVRIHDAEMQAYIFSEVLQLNGTEQRSFDHLLHALKFGAPPHGGIALGLDRLMTILCNTASIRDVIAFPKTGAGTDTLFKSPAPVRSGVLEQYGIKST